MTGARRGAASLLGAVLLGAGCVAWAAAPPVHNGWAGFALFLAIAGVAAGALRLALAGVPVPEDSYLLPAPVRAGLSFLATLRLLPWEEGAVVAIVWLEVLHPARPWHTAVLGAALIAYLLATHLAESDASPRALRPQARVLAAGAVLLALGAGAGMLPAAGPGPARPCCGWWRRARSSPRPASSCPRSRGIGERSESLVPARYRVVKARFPYKLGLVGGRVTGGAGRREDGDSRGTRKGGG